MHGAALVIECTVSVPENQPEKAIVSTELPRFGGMG